jgi:hypothetical protein
VEAAVSALREATKSEEAMGELAAGFGRFFGDRVAMGPTAASDEATEYRERSFTLQVTFWAFLLQVLTPGCACREVVRHVQLWWRERDGEKTLSSDTGAYCKARARLPLPWLEELFEALCAKLSAGVAAHQLWCGRRVMLVDGTTVSMPDTAANQELWPQQKGQKPGCGFPLMRLVGLFCLCSGGLMKTARGTMYQAEGRLVRALWSLFKQGDVALADRGFCSFAMIARLLANGVDSVMRLHQRRRLGTKEGEWLGEGDRLITWKRPPRSQAGLEGKSEDYDTLAPELKLRVIQWRIEVPGFRTQEVILVTTLLDPEVYPAKALQDLYLRRWGVELYLREIKVLLGMDVLRCKSPAMIEREVLLHQIAYNLVRCVMQEAAQKHSAKLERLSFKGTLDTMRAWAPAIHAARHQPNASEERYSAMLAIIAEDLLPYRPHRSEPRAKKRRPKNYHLLTKPRRQMHVPSHRNRPKPVSS